MKRWQTLIVIRELQRKMMIRYFTYSMVEINVLATVSAIKYAEQPGALTVMHNGTATLQNTLAVSYKTKYKLTISSV